MGLDQIPKTNRPIILHYRVMFGDDAADCPDTELQKGDPALTPIVVEVTGNLTEKGALLSGMSIDLRILDDENEKECFLPPAPLNSENHTNLTSILKTKPAPQKKPTPKKIDPTYFTPKEKTIAKAIQEIEKNRKCPDQFWDEKEMVKFVDEIFKSGCFIQGQKEALKESKEFKSCAINNGKKYMHDTVRFSKLELEGKVYSADGRASVQNKYIQDTQSPGIFTNTSSSDGGRSYRVKGNNIDYAYCKLSEHVYVLLGFDFTDPTKKYHITPSSKVDIDERGFIYVP